MPAYRRLVIAWLFVPMHRLFVPAFRRPPSEPLGRCKGSHSGDQGTQERQATLVAFAVLPIQRVRRLDCGCFQLRPGPSSRVVLEHRRRPESFRRNQRRALRRRGPHSPRRRTHRAVRQSGCDEFTLRHLSRRYRPPNPCRRAPPRLAAHTKGNQGRWGIEVAGFTHTGVWGWEKSGKGFLTILMFWPHIPRVLPDHNLPGSWEINF